jgi:hypothetical protein
MIDYIETPNPDDRLNSILDKIIKSGIKSLQKDEKIFLKSYSVGKELEINKMLSDKERERTFMSDDGNFTFKFDNVEEIEDDIKCINGTLIVPDLVIKNKTIKGKLKGSIILFKDRSVAIDFRSGRHEVFEFINGMEYELDCFIDDIVDKMEKSNN